MKRRLILAFKIAVSVSSLYIVSGSVAWDELFAALHSARFLFLFAALASFWVAQCVSSLRCVYIVRTLGGKVDFYTSLRAHFVGLWFNQVLPTSLGGDVLKTTILKKPLGLGMAVRSVLLDRFSGLMFLLLATAVALPWYADIFAGQPALVAGLAGLALGGWLVTVIGAWSAHRLMRIGKIGVSLRNVVQIFSDVWAFRAGLPLWGQSWTSAIVHLNGIVTFALVGTALGLRVDLLLFVLIVPIVFLVALLPVSYAGWGVREAGAVWLFGMVGVPRESAMAMSVCFGLLLVVAGLPGLIVLNWPGRSDAESS